MKTMEKITMDGKRTYLSSLAGRASRFSLASTGLSLGLILVLSLCVSPVTAQQSLVVVGSGSTVPAPLYVAWSQEYSKRNSGIQIRYVPVGTEEGIKQVSHGSGDFAAGEMPLSEKQRAEDGLVELPVAIIGIVPIYNVPHLQQELRLSGEVLADIYLGVIKNWNSAQISKLNPGVDLSDLPIKVVQRPAGKGSNYVFTEFLSKSNARFRSQIGASLSPNWPVGQPAERSADMAEKVKAEPGSIGFVEFQYAAKNGIQQALVLNSAGKFVKASSRTLLAACENTEAPEWHSLSATLINARGADSYPMASFTWLYLPVKSQDSARAAAMANLLSWIFKDGQTVAEQLGYTGLPTQLLTEARKKVANLH
jgi:phosphate transport system substrate-binding protein